MSNKKLVILGIVAVFMVAWAVVQSRVSNRPRTKTDTPAYLIQGLDPADIDGIVFGAGESAVTLKRQGGRFVVAGKDNYPTEISEINSLLSKSLEIQKEQFITDDAANHETLEVTEEKARSVVKFLKPDSSLLVGFAIGKDKELGQGSYVRLLPGDKVYTAINTPWIRTGAMDYIEQELISVKREDIESVTVGSANGEYTLKTEEDGEDIVLENTPAGKKLKDSDGDSVFTALTNLRCDDVKRKSDDLTFDRQFVCGLKDSTVYTLKIAQKDDKTYISCAAAFMDKTPVLKGDEVESEEELKKKEAKLLARDKAKEFTAKHQQWLYEIAEWKAKNLTKELSDLLEDEQKPEEAEKTEDPNAVEAEAPLAPAVTPLQENSVEPEP
ncbi:MAG: DUF4340 domain-containing protein [Planctomycetota bacterium]|jgi:hypothetical protein